MLLLCVAFNRPCGDIYATKLWLGFQKKKKKRRRKQKKKKTILSRSRCGASCRGEFLDLDKVECGCRGHLNKGGGMNLQIEVSAITLQAS